VAQELMTAGRCGTSPVESGSKSPPAQPVPNPMTLAATGVSWFRIRFLSGDRLSRAEMPDSRWQHLQHFLGDERVDTQAIQFLS